MKVKSNFVMREIVGDYILVPTGIEALEFGGIITTNDVGAFLWEQLQNEISMEDLVKLVVEAFEIDEQTATVDIREFIETLKQLQLLE